jgi:hypothetical protein
LDLRQRLVQNAALVFQKLRRGRDLEKKKKKGKEGSRTLLGFMMRGREGRRMWRGICACLFGEVGRR